MKNIFIFLILCFVSMLTSFSVHANVILQYHHVSESTPVSTSISPEQFNKHMQYLADNNFHVIALNKLVDALKNKQPIADKTIVITFDDAYLNILENAKPILDKFGYPFTIFINPGIVNRGSSQYLSWPQLKKMADEGVIIANHGFEHDSWARKPEGIDTHMWLIKKLALLETAEKTIKRETGQSWRYFAYPYGEFTPRIQQALEEQQFVAFSQQSGAVGNSTSLTSIPRFPASQPYDNLKSLRDKLHSLPFNVQLSDKAAQTIYKKGQLQEITFNVVKKDFRPHQLNCYVTGLGKQPVEWLNDTSFSITFTSPLPTGRVRSNCTAPSIEKTGRYYWYSKPWFILNDDNSWYPL